MQPQQKPRQMWNLLGNQHLPQWLIKHNCEMITKKFRGFLPRLSSLLLPCDISPAIMLPSPAIREYNKKPSLRMGTRPFMKLTWRKKQHRIYFRTSPPATLSPTWHDFVDVLLVKPCIKVYNIKVVDFLAFWLSFKWIQLLFLGDAILSHLHILLYGSFKCCPIIK